MKILGYIPLWVSELRLSTAVPSLGKGNILKHILIDVGGMLVALAGLWLLEIAKMHMR